MTKQYNDRSPVAAEAERVVILPGGPARSVVVAVALAETAVLKHIYVIVCNKCKTKDVRTFLPVLVRPRDSRCLCTGLVIQLIRGSRRIWEYGLERAHTNTGQRNTYRLVVGVDEDDLVVLVDAILVDPVGVENSQVGASSTDSFFGSGSEGSLVLQLVDTLVGGLAWKSQKLSVCHSLSSSVNLVVSRTVCSTPPRRPLATTTSNSNSVDHVALLGLVTQS